VVTTETAKGHIDKLLSFRIFLISRAKFSYLGVFSASVLGLLRVKELPYLLQVLFYSIDGRCIGSAEIYRCISYDRPVPI